MKRTRSFIYLLPISCLAFLISTKGYSQSNSADIRKIIKDTGADTISSLLSHLDSELRGRFTLMYESQSQQNATPQKPRVIMYSTLADFVMAFNGDPKLAGYDVLEMIDFNRETNKFEFSFIRFPKDAGESGAVEFSGKNPKVCQTCHREDLRPNWNGYPVWFGAYGTVHRRGTTVINESAELAKLRNNRSGRYIHLYRFQSYTTEGYKHRNLALNSRLSALNFKRILNQVEASPDFNKFKYALAGAAKDCEIETFLPPEIHNKMQRELSSYIDESFALARAISAEYKAVGGIGTTFYRPSQTGKLRYLLEGRGISMKDWSMPFSKHNYNFSSGRSGIYDFYEILLMKYELPAECSNLEQLSLQAFAKS